MKRSRSVTAHMAIHLHVKWNRYNTIRLECFLVCVQMNWVNVKYIFKWEDAKMCRQFTNSRRNVIIWVMTAALGCCYCLDTVTWRLCWNTIKYATACFGWKLFVKIKANSFLWQITFFPFCIRNFNSSQLEIH